MPVLIDRPRTLKPPSTNQKGVVDMAHLLEEAKVAPELETIRAEIVSLLHDMGNGHSFTILSNDKELSPTQAADLLDVSRSHFMRIIRNNSIPYRMVGAHYRVRLEDVLKYREIRLQRRQLLDELTDQAQELNMGY